MPKPDYYHEKQISISGFKLIAGIDEVGRGTLAGPVVAGVIIIDINDNVEQTLIKLGVNDSKALTANKRKDLYKQLIDISTDYSTGWASSKEIDKIGINPAIELSIIRAIKNLKIEPDHLLIDAIRKYFGKNQSLDIKTFKELTSTSRKFAVPLLEYLDKIGITYRLGNERKLKE